VDSTASSGVDSAVTNPSAVTDLTKSSLQPPRLRQFTRVIDQTWQRTSYSALTAQVSHVAADPDLADEPETPLQPVSDDVSLDWLTPDHPTALWPEAKTAEPTDLTTHGVPAGPKEQADPATGNTAELEEQADLSTGDTAEPEEQADPAPSNTAEPKEQADPAPPGTVSLSLDDLSPMADLPGGVAFGSLVHTVFERADPAQPESVAAMVTDAVTRFGLTGLTPQTLLTALQPGLETSLGPLADEVRLADISLSDRLAELSFELPLAATGRPATLHQLADLLDRHLRPDDPLASYGARLRADLPATLLSGFLTGSIDVVLRLGQPARYLIVDYKTNRLAPPDQPLRLRSYTPARLATAMMDSHYPLQALLYNVALHRFLRWRLADYQPQQQLGGIAYLFVRGLAGPGTPRIAGQPCGVFAWRPPTELILDLDAALAGRQP
jgi:exodeoxyribonuclease V beta subunit